MGLRYAQWNLTQQKSGGLAELQASSAGGSPLEAGLTVDPLSPYVAFLFVSPLPLRHVSYLARTGVLTTQPAAAGPVAIQCKGPSDRNLWQLQSPVGLLTEAVRPVVP